MSPDEINAAIAELCGWTKCKPFINALGYEVQEWEKAGELTEHCMSVHTLDEMPNYHGSLDACATFEATLNAEDREHYKAYLIDIVFAYPETRKGVIFATATQRCEAFLRLKGKWTA